MTGRAEVENAVGPDGQRLYAGTGEPHGRPVPGAPPVEGPPRPARARDDEGPVWSLGDLLEGGDPELRPPIGLAPEGAVLACSGQDGTLAPRQVRHLCRLDPRPQQHAAAVRSEQGLAPGVRWVDRGGGQDPAPRRDRQVERPVEGGVRSQGLPRGALVARPEDRALYPGVERVDGSSHGAGGSNRAVAEGPRPATVGRRGDAARGRGVDGPVGGHVEVVNVTARVHGLPSRSVVVSAVCLGTVRGDEDGLAVEDGEVADDACPRPRRGQRGPGRAAVRRAVEGAVGDREHGAAVVGLEGEDGVLERVRPLPGVAAVRGPIDVGEGLRTNGARRGDEDPVRRPGLERAQNEPVVAAGLEAGPVPAAIERPEDASAANGSQHGPVRPDAEPNVGASEKGGVGVRLVRAAKGLPRSDLGGRGRARQGDGEKENREGTG